MRTFTTSDGYLLYNVGVRWVDSINPDTLDATFDDKGGVPVDCFGESLDGKFGHACNVCGTDLGWNRPSGVCSQACLHEAQGFEPRGLHEKCERIIRKWSQWSRAERRKMDDIVTEIMDHVINGGGNAFVVKWCEDVLTPALEAQGVELRK
jgi:hypothetical protein